MKKLITLVTIMATSLIFTACGGGGGGSTASGYAGTATAANTAGTALTGIGSDDPAATATIVPLNIGEATPVDAGYSIVDSSEDAVLDILVVGESKTVTLMVGAASLKMPI